MTALLESLAGDVIHITAMPDKWGNASLMRPMTIESLVFGYPDHTINWVEKILPILEKASVMHQ